jgi:predicted alpha/beta hydrolase
MKGSADVEAMIPKGLIFYAQICGWTLARAHARSGDAVAMAAYLGDDRAFDKAFADFAERYADQNELDYQAFLDAIASGRIEARPGV